MADAAKQEPVVTMWSKEFTYDRWMKSKGIPIHRGYFIEDLRTVELEWWEEGAVNRHLFSCSGRRA